MRFGNGAAPNSRESVGLEPETNLESSFIHKDLQMVLRVYADEFKMVGPSDNTKKAWSVIRGVIAMDGPTSLGK